MKIYPVIHCKSFDQVRRNMDILHDKNILHGIRGVFLINHGEMQKDQFFRLVETIVYQSSPDLEIGANFLSGCYPFMDNEYERSDVLKFISGTGIKNLWIDNAGCDFPILKFIKTNVLDFYAALRKYCLRKYCPNIKIFGGLHFKYQPKASMPIKESIEQLYGLWPNSIPTISGKQTGEPPTLDAIKEALPSFNQDPNFHIVWTQDKLAIASGANKDNIKQFKQYISHCLIASSLLKDDDKYMFNSQKLQEFIEAAK